MPGIEFTPSAEKHGYTKADAISAMSEPVHGPIPIPARMTGPDPLLVIGRPARPDVLAPLIEVMYVLTHSQVVIFHVMAVQQANLDRFD